MESLRNSFPPTRNPDKKKKTRTAGFPSDKNSRMAFSTLVGSFEIFMIKNSFE
jgi:hypothetical protein